MPCPKKARNGLRRHKGEGHRFMRPNGTYGAELTVDYKKYSVYGKTDSEVTSKLNKLKQQIEDGTILTRTNRVTLGAWLETFLEDFAKAKIRNTSLVDYRDVARCHIIPALGRYQLKNLTGRQIQRLYNQKLEGGLSASRVRKIHAVLHSSLERAISEGYIARNVAHGLIVPQPDKTERSIPTPEQQEKLLAVVSGHRLFAAFLLLPRTGMRRGEVLAARWDKLDWVNKILTIWETLVYVPGRGIRSSRQEFHPLKERRKNSKKRKGYREIPLEDDMIAVLKEHKRRQTEERLFLGNPPNFNMENLIFCSSLGKPINLQSFSDTFERLVKKAGLEGITAHCLRHTFTTNLLENGINPKTIQELLGHAGLDMTVGVYGHSSLESKRRAIASLSALPSAYAISKAVRQQKTAANTRRH